MTSPYSEDTTTDDNLATSWLAKADRFSDAHMRQALLCCYTASILVAWCAGFITRGPIGEDDLQSHWVPVIVHGCVAVTAGGVAFLIGDDEGLTPRNKTLVLGIVASSALMFMVSALVEAICA